LFKCRRSLSKPNRFAVICLAAACAFVVVVTAPAAGQTPAKPAAKPASKTYIPGKTPWGDPDLQGVYTNKDESGIPFERPSQFEGKKLDDVDDSEFAEIVKQRNDAARARAPLAGGAETGAGPIHWFENYDAKNSRAWLVVDPADGAIPTTTPDAEQRARRLVPRRRMDAVPPQNRPFPDTR
jgi:hypothetical protein